MIKNVTKRAVRKICLLLFDYVMFYLANVVVVEETFCIRKNMFGILWWWFDDDDHQDRRLFFPLFVWLKYVPLYIYRLERSILKRFGKKKFFHNNNKQTNKQKKRKEWPSSCSIYYRRYIGYILWRCFSKKNLTKMKDLDVLCENRPHTFFFFLACWSNKRTRKTEKPKK